MLSCNVVICLSNQRIRLCSWKGEVGGGVAYTFQPFHTMSWRVYETTTPRLAGRKEPPAGQGSDDEPLTSERQLES